MNFVDCKLLRSINPKPFNNILIKLFPFHKGKSNIQLFGDLINSMITFEQFQKLPDTGRNINLTIITEIRIAFTLNPQVVLVAVLVLGVL